MKQILFPMAFIAIFSFATFAQTTAFTYQGKLNDLGVSANGQYQITFTLYDAASEGNQIGLTLEDVNVSVTDGIFTTKLDFGVDAFASGDERFIELSVRRNAGESYVTLTPRQPVTSTPYAVKALLADTATTAENSNQLGGLNASDFVQTNDPALTDARDPLPGSANYVQNTTSPQPMSNFNISGVGKANAFDATVQYNINGGRVLGVAGTNNVFVGFGSGTANTTGAGNTFLGATAGTTNTTGDLNTFAGFQTGFSNTTGKWNAFFGGQAGLFTTTGSSNSFFGTFSGAFNTTGGGNSFFGLDAGRHNTEGNNNSFFGVVAGRENTTGINNAFFGRAAGRLNTTGSYNAFFGPEAGFSNNANANAFFGSAAGRQNTGGFNNSFFGADAGRLNTTGSYNSFFGFQAGHSNALGNGNAFFGSLAGFANTSGGANSFVGVESGKTNSTGNNNAFFGPAAGRDNETGSYNVFLGSFTGSNHTAGQYNTFVGANAGVVQTNGTQNTAIGAGASVGDGLSFATAIGGGASVTTSNTIVLGRSGGQDKVRLPGLGAAGMQQLCRNVDTEIAPCSSSLRYKTNVNAFSLGLDVVNRLKPITFDWKDGGMQDLGLGAEDVAAVNELLVVRDSEGQIEGVKYDRIGVVLLNAVKEQQAEIEVLKQQIEELKKLVGHQTKTRQRSRRGEQR